jgi:hypothetical protein
MKSEDEDEKIIMWARKLIRVDQEEKEDYRKRSLTDKDAIQMSTGYDAQLLKVQEQAKNEGSCYSAIFSSPHCVEYIRSLLSMAGHFRRSKLLKHINMQKMTEGTGGVSHFYLTALY